MAGKEATVRNTVGGVFYVEPVTDEERTTLQLAAATYQHPAIRETHALEQLGLTPTFFWAKVHGLLDRPDALAEMPVEVRRLTRLRDARRARRGRR